ncbi:hypothetical protein ScPMuIL_009741 [Solemya velum]
MRFVLALIQLLLFYGVAQSTTGPNLHDPVISSKYVNERGVPVIHGTIREDETTVTLNPELKATDADELDRNRYICAYRIVTPQALHTIPFLIELKDRTTGAAVINVVEGERLDYEKRSSYKFSIVADDCGEQSRESNRAIVMIHVEDVDEFAPRFDQTTYFVDVQEHEISNNLMQMKAVDDDRSPTYKGICGYEILTPNAPFAINNQGVLSNTEKLEYNNYHNYILKVVAVDCGGKRSQPVFINVKVKEVCKSGWQGIPEHIDYVPNSGHKKLAEQARLQLCGDACTPDKISVRLKLATKHIGKGCDRDTYSITSQRKLCGASGESVDLLPSPSITSNWTLDIPTDDGHESDQIFAFNGKTNAAEVPNGLVSHSLSKHFTISTWMKHEKSNPNLENKHKKAEKEHILCMSDGEYMNRHHYAWFIHGEKMVFLLRREADKSNDMEVFKPAEWRWHIPQINDRQWHHYAISVDFPEVRLYIDGKIFVPDKKNYEIIDDWPLHLTTKVHFTKLVIGACYQGGEHSFAHYFQGYLAGLSMLKDKTESDRVIKCLNNCKENLDFHALNEMTSGTTVSFNTEMTQFSFEGKNVTELETLLSEITYVNFRRYPTPGRRNLNIQTTLQCTEQETNLPEVSTYVMVQQVQQPVISLDGAKTFTTTPDDLRMGQKVFSDIFISADVSVEEEEEEDEDLNETNRIDTKVQKVAFKVSQTLINQAADAKQDEQILLDTCQIRADPPLDLHIEQLSIPEELMSQFNMRLETSETNNGLVISNADSIDNYKMLLRGISYYNNRAEEMSSRKFVASCSSQNGRFVSNDLTIEVIPVHVEPNIQVHAHAQQADHVQIIDNKLNGVGLDDIADITPNVGMAVIIVVCVGFLLFMIILGVIRIRTAHRRTQVVNVEEKQEMEWDNSELNITVNPLQKEVFEYEDSPMRTLRDESDSDDDGSSYHDDGESDEEEPAKVPERELEWDDSTLSI